MTVLEQIKLYDASLTTADEPVVQMLIDDADALLDMCNADKAILFTLVLEDVARWKKAGKPSATTVNRAPSLDRYSESTNRLIRLAQKAKVR